MTRELTSEIISAAIEVHKELGPGLLEKVYRRCLQLELQDRGYTAQAELDLPALYKGWHPPSSSEIRGLK